MERVIIARRAMATRFEIVLCGEDVSRLRAAGEEALDEIERLDEQLSLYRTTSEISRINSRAANEWVRVEPALFNLLWRAKELSEQTEGAFDITVAPLMRCWGFMAGQGAPAAPDEVADALSRVGSQFIEFSKPSFTIRFAKPGMMLDLGAIGKGYALDRAAAILADSGVRSALLHGGTSTIYGLGSSPEGPWKIAITAPPDDPGRIQSGLPSDPANARSDQVLQVVELEDSALSVSAPHGKFFSKDGKLFGHVLDPRTGYPIEGAVIASVQLPSATETDALSTALLTLGPGGQEKITSLRPGMRTLVGWRGGAGEPALQVRVL